MFDLQTGVLLLWTLFSLCRTAPLYNDQRILQHSKYGRSLVLVGGNLQENNTEVYDTIIRMAVSLFKIITKKQNKTNSCLDLLYQDSVVPVDSLHTMIIPITYDSHETHWLYIHLSNTIKP